MVPTIFSHTSGLIVDFLFCFHVEFMHLTDVFLLFFMSFLYVMYYISLQWLVLIEFYLLSPYSLGPFFLVLLCCRFRRINKGQVHLVKDRALLVHQLLLVLEEHYSNASLYHFDTFSINCCSCFCILPINVFLTLIATPILSIMWVRFRYMCGKTELWQLMQNFELF